MTEYVTGQNYGWNGGECPVHPKTKIEVWMRNCLGSDVGKAGDILWGHENVSSDIIAFKVITPYVEPKVIWVNEYARDNFAYSSEADALKDSNFYTKRVAVKYVEVKK